MSKSNYPEKETPNAYPLLDIIKKRWSPVSFSDEEIEEEKIMSLFEAMRWAPSCYNEQPWRVVYATKKDREDYEKLSELLVGPNSWAKNAYMLLVICCERRFSKNNKDNKYAKYDAGAGALNLFLQAVSMGLIGHEMAGFSTKKAYSELNIPKDDVEVIAMMAVGYPANPDDMTEELKKRDNEKRTRNPVGSFIKKGSYR